LDIYNIKSNPRKIKFMARWKERVQEGLCDKRTMLDHQPRKKRLAVDYHWSNVGTLEGIECVAKPKFCR